VCDKVDDKDSDKGLEGVLGYLSREPVRRFDFIGDFSLQTREPLDFNDHDCGRGDGIFEFAEDCECVKHQ
jgi:hypothetical protein